MDIARHARARTRDIAFFAVFLVYAWAGIDTRLIYHWQGPVFYTIPGFFDEFLKYPGGPADYLYGLIAQAYAYQGWGAIVLTAQVVAVAVLTQVYFTMLAGRALPLVRFIPAALLLYHANLYYDRTPLLPALLLGLALAILFGRLSRRWRGEAALLGAFAAMLAAAYYGAGMAIVFFAPAAAIVHIARRPRLPFWILYLLLAAALPAAVEWFRWLYLPVSARDWFAPPDARRLIVYWGLYLFYALGTAIALRRRSRSSPAPRKKPRLMPLLQTPLLLLGLASAAVLSYQLNGRDRRLAALDYYSFAGDWPAVIDASRRLATGDFNSLTCYQVNLALHELNRLGDEMFRFPQSGSMLPKLRDHTFLPYMIHITDLCLRLGRINEAEHFGSEAMVLRPSDPRVYRLMARIHMVKGQTAAARKFLNVLSDNPGSGGWARRRLRELEQDPQLAGDPEVQLLRRRMLRNDDMLPVWQRGDKPDGDMERLLLDQLDQDPSNRMAFEFLMGTYLLARDMVAFHALMPRIKEMTGPAYVGPGGRRRTPRHYQEAMALYAAFTGQTVQIEGLEIQPETARRMAAFRRIMEQSATKEAAWQAAWNDFRDTYFFYFFFGPGDYR